MVACRKRAGIVSVGCIQFIIRRSLDGIEKEGQNAVLQVLYQFV